MSRSRNTTIIQIFIAVLGIVTMVFLVRWYIAKHSGAVLAADTDQSISDGVITIPYASTTTGLAVNQSQILVNSYIPPCDANFDYCLYYTGTEYRKTNFESAGVRIKKRADLNEEHICTDTPPTGYDATVLPDKVISTDGYASSVFSSVDGAATGHYSEGSLYRLYAREAATCYEFETRVGESQYANYPAGSITLFTQRDTDVVFAQMRTIVQGVSLGKVNNLFPLL